jgi:uncharacterized protein (DUF58 family)
MLTSIKRLLAMTDRKAWVRFFFALGGLVLAFGAALLSTVFRESGNLFAMNVAAAVALLTAGFVGIYSIPYLAKRVAIEGMREAFDYDVTSEGMVYLSITVVIGVASLTSGNNLLFIILAAMLAAIIISGVASAHVLRGLRLDMALPEQVFAKQPVIAKLSLQNQHWTPSFSVSVVPPKSQTKGQKHWQWERGIFSFPPGRAEGKRWVNWPDLKLRLKEAAAANDSIFHGSIYFPYIASRGDAHANVELNFPRRGRYVQNGFGLATRFPFSFLMKTRRVRLTREMVVYPSVEPADDFFHVLPMVTGEFEAYVRGRGHDLYRIREYLPEDSARLVDWKATAKSGALKVREFTREDERKLRIVFDNPAPGTVTPEDYEAAIQLTASLAWHFSDGSTQLSFVAPGYGGSGEVLDFLHYLALVQLAAADSVLSGIPLTEDYNLVVTAQPHGSVPTRLWASSYIVFMDKGH